jgi:hypothetical protein
MSNKICIVISHYLGRDNRDLINLINQLDFFKSNLIVSINDDNALSESYSNINGVNFVVRPNIGMNIGGWGAAIKYCQDYDKIIFMQDECIIKDFDFISQYSDLLDNIGAGIVGESINPKWNKSWDLLANSPLNYNVETLEGLTIPRVENYIQCLNKWGINPGKTGLHLRSLVWAFNTSFLSIINNFPIGLNKEECIAVEIGVNKLVEQNNLKILQSATYPFRYIQHKEWKTDGWSKILL